MDRRAQLLIEAATEAMLYWHAKAEQLNADYDRLITEAGDAAVAKLGARCTPPQRRVARADGRLQWAKTAQAKDLLGAGQWAHRKASSNAALIQALCARHAALGDAARPLPASYDNGFVYGFDRESSR